MFSLNEMISWRARIHPDLVALVDERDDSVTYAAFDRRIADCARRWQRRGVSTGQVVAVLDTNSIAYFTNLLGLSRIGAIPALLNWRLTAPENTALFDLVQPVAVAVGPDLADRLPESLPAIRVGLAGQADGWAPEDSTVDSPDSGSSADGQPTSLPPLPAPSEVFALGFSSGTTGRPKAIPMRHESLARSALVDSAEVLGMSAGSRQLMVAPTFHLAGLANTLMGLASGAEIHLRERFDPDRVLTDIENLRIEYLTGVPAMYRALMLAMAARETPPDTTSMLEMTYGASPIPGELVNEIRTAFPNTRLRQFYGMTEIAGALTTLRPADHDPASPHRLSAGTVNPGFSVRLVDRDGNEVPDRTPGEIMIRGATIMHAYWNDPEATAAAIDDGWFASGDIAIADNGYLTIMDRAKDMVVSGGENVYPAEVESALYEHPAVVDAAVIGVPDDRFGERVHAIIVAPEHPDIDAIVEFCRERLAGYKVPRSVEIVDELPRNATGKILKHQLRAAHWEGHDRAI